MCTCRGKGKRVLSWLCARPRAPCGVGTHLPELTTGTKTKSRKLSRLYHLSTLKMLKTS